MSLVRPRATRSKAMMLASFAGGTAAFALVIWIKLRVVTTIPKQAYAEPEAEQRQAAPGEPSRTAKKATAGSR